MKEYVNNSIMVDYVINIHLYVFFPGVDEPTAAYEILNQIFVSSQIPDASIAVITEKNSMVVSILFSFHYIRELRMFHPS